MKRLLSFAAHSDATLVGCSQSTIGTSQQAVEESSRSPGKSKMFQDPLHGQIKLDSLLVRVMDTPEFSRLAEIKQLGGSVYVYASANHTRKVHSIGVSHLAGKAATHLRDNQPELSINNDDILCVKLAGLVHDIGHGPFSHMFEEFIHKHGRALVAKGESEQAQPFIEWTHERMCDPILRQLIGANGIQLADYFEDGASEDRLRFVVALVNGLGDDEPWPSDLSAEFQSKRFLFDIVNNKRNGIDVDKLDYLARDALAAFGSSKPPGFDSLRIIDASKVLSSPAGGALQLGYEEKMMRQDIKKVFDMRTEQHQNVYQHRVVEVAEQMITDILMLANPVYRYRGADGKPISLTEAAVTKDCASYILLNDSIVEQINTSLAPELEAARELIRRLKSSPAQDYYQRVGESVKLCMLPRCLECRADTEISAQFCSKCGVSTEHRIKRAILDKRTNEPTHLYQSEHAALSEAAVRDELLRLCDPALTPQQADAFYVSIVEIFHGKKTPRRDHWGHMWIAHDPHARVGWFNPKEEEPHELNYSESDSAGRQGINRTAETALRTLSCFMKYKDKVATESIEAALDTWRKQHHAHPEQGTANSMPSSLAGTPRRQAVRVLSRSAI